MGGLIPVLLVLMAVADFLKSVSFSVSLGRLVFYTQWVESAVQQLGGSCAVTACKITILHCCRHCKASCVLMCS